MEYTYYINGIQCDEQEFLQEMVNAGAMVQDIVDLADDYSFYINGTQCSEWAFLQEMVDYSARLDDFVEVANGYTYTAGNSNMFWVVKGEQDND